MDAVKPVLNDCGVYMLDVNCRYRYGPVDVNLDVTRTTSVQKKTGRQ